MTNTNWIDRSEYPFFSHHFQAPAGKMHYVGKGDGLPRSRTVKLPTVGHFVQEEAPQELAQAVTAFLNQEVFRG
jgi:pimeloyl-ACP methyl ester carboxylesterase